MQPLPNWPAPIFQACHHFVLPQGTEALAAIYHQDVPAWAYDSDGNLIGCILRNTPGGPHGASGTDQSAHSLSYALRVPSGLQGPESCQPLAEAMRYCRPPVAALIPSNSSGTLPETNYVASITSGTGVIVAVKPSTFTRESIIVRIYQATNAQQTLDVSMTSPPKNAQAMTALEDPWTGANGPTPMVSTSSTGFSVQMDNALATIELSS